MASIKISELCPAGYELFQDSESFLNELSDDRELDSVEGATVSIFISQTVGFFGLSVSYPSFSLILSLSLNL